VSDLVEAGRKAWREGDLAQARRLAEQALDEAESIGDRPATIEALSFLAERTHYDGDTGAAIELQHRLLDLKAQEYGADSLELVPSLGNLALMFGRIGDLEAKEKTLHRSLALMDAHHVVNDSYAIALYNLAHAVRRGGRYDEFVSLLERSLKVCRAVNRKDDPYLADTLFDLGKVRIDQGRWDEAEELLSSALSMSRSFRGGPSWGFRFAHDLGYLYALHERWTDALPHYEEALETVRRAGGDEDSIYLAQTMSSLGLCLTNLSEGDRAEPLLSDALEMLVRVGAPSERVGETALRLAGELDRQGRTAEAMRLRVDFGVGWPEAVD
jgi:tetratricopeptide (TPR) repeat protein